MARFMIVLASTTVALSISGLVALNSLDNPKIAGERLRARALDRERINARQFGTEFEGVVEELRAGLPLKHAISQVHELAEEHESSYLRGLRYAENASTVDGRIGQNILRHLHVLHGDNTSPELLARLHKELAELQ